MEQLKGLWRDTKYLWLGFAFASVAFAAFGSWYHLALIPCLPVCFTYFAWMRYDENGKPKNDFNGADH
ncbi:MULTISPECIES: hypothetical protein [Rosistilla]|uniref:Uncharacterized protein n=2 Tax=Rosistilla TaxID=2795779 RepID=A0A518IPR1_9BACT|nr:MULTISPECIES: hypothetical protein [Rosistilla]QDV55081.1 hypothetical protein Mal33_10500 [Rosistilla oblonga]QDV67067.1 hypothetical protein Poly24_07580 [Rosistilla carotiformis]